MFGDHVHILDFALHMDETTPHIHERHVFDCENKYGELCPQQEKALEALGIPLPDPDKPRGRNNNRKMTFDLICRNLLFDVCRQYGLEIEEAPEYGGKKYLEKQEFIIQAQKEKIARQEQMIKEQEEKIMDNETLIDEVSEIAYEKLRGHWIMEMSEMIAAISAKSNEEIKSFLSRQKDTFRNSYGKFEEDRPRQCLFAGTTNTKQFLPFDRTGARRFLAIEVDSSKAEKHLLDNEEESRAYFDQLWAEAMVIFNSCKDKSSLLKLPKEMEEQIIDYRKQFMQEDTMAGQVQGWLDGYAGTYVCSRQIWKEAFNHYDGEPRKYETNEICQIMDTQIIGWKRGGYHRFSKEGFGTQRCWIREGKGETETVNQLDKDGFIKLTEGEQMKIPFD